ncbi:TPA: sce7726 family protein, partial [Klebsiella pneumoniae subsp. pneumoniae]|nr:sce7726 family protein [Klebsiella pneumoniae subsp. pneumoniae]
MMRSNDLNSFQLTALSRLFSASVFSEIAKKGQSPMFARSLRETELFDHADTLGITVGEAFNEAFALLRQTGLRNEYVYRSALTHNLLLGKHSLRTACMLNEFRIGSCKADLIILNGTGTVYEIKSERDSLSRLHNQITNYRKAFGKIYVIAGSEHIDDVLKTTESTIGVLSLTRWNRISTIREAEEVLDFLCPVTIFESLRINEAKIIASELG